MELSIDPQRFDLLWSGWTSSIILKKAQWQRKNKFLWLVETDRNGPRGRRLKVQLRHFVTTHLEEGWVVIDVKVVEKGRRDGRVAETSGTNGIGATP